MGKITVPLIISILVIVTGLYSIETLKRNFIWKDNYTLVVDMVKKSPDGHIPHNELGLIYYNRRLLDKAMEHYLIALRLKPDYIYVHNNLGAAYIGMGLFGEAMEHYLTALRLKPDFPEAQDSLRKILEERSKKTRAKK